MRFPRYLITALLSTLITATVATAEEFITVASTTSTQNSGLFDFILPKFQAQTGIQVRVVAVGTGQAIKNARNGDTDVLFVHHQPSEEQFIADGLGVQRFNVMYNDFVVIGPSHDPAAIRGQKNVVQALAAIAEARLPFTSRGDDSGTHKKELSLWQAAGVDVNAASGSWYRETGSGMGATLNIASGMNAYLLSDRATWLNFGNKGNLVILSEGDSRLFNQYGIILVNPQQHPHIKAEAGQKFIDWILSDAGQKRISEYNINGQQAFFPNANDS